VAIAPMAPLLTAHERNWDMIESALEGMIDGWHKKIWHER
jgi:hypothetical protein